MMPVVSRARQATGQKQLRRSFARSFLISAPTSASGVIVIPSGITSGRGSGRDQCGREDRRSHPLYLHHAVRSLRVLRNDDDQAGRPGGECARIGHSVAELRYAGPGLHRHGGVEFGEKLPMLATAAGLAATVPAGAIGGVGGGAPAGSACPSWAVAGGRGASMAVWLLRRAGSRLPGAYRTQVCYGIGALLIRRKQTARWAEVIDSAQ